MHLIKITLLMIDGSKQTRYATSRQNVQAIADRYISETPGAVHALRRPCELDISEHRGFLVSQAQQMDFLALGIKRCETAVGRASESLSKALPALQAAR